MYEYKYEECTVLRGWFSDPNYREIIDKRAKEGWRMVQVVPVSYNTDGTPYKFEVIFEREVK